MWGLWSTWFAPHTSLRALKCTSLQKQLAATRRVWPNAQYRRPMRLPARTHSVLIETGALSGHRAHGVCLLDLGYIYLTSELLDEVDPTEIDSLFVKAATIAQTTGSDGLLARALFHRAVHSPLWPGRGCARAT